MTAPAPQNAVLDTVSESRQPFGLPLGSVRGLMSLFICGFFWLVLLWPSELGTRPLLGHFFLLALVLMAFASGSSARAEEKQSRFIPTLLRFLFVGGSILVVGFCLLEYPERLQHRLSPKADEFAQWWFAFLCTMSAGFAVGLFARFVLGRQNYIFQTLRAWLSVVGLVMLAVELGIFAVVTTSESKPEDFLRYWQIVEVAVISAYFGSRA